MGRAAGATVQGGLDFTDWKFLPQVEPRIGILALDSSRWNFLAGIFLAGIFLTGIFLQESLEGTGFPDSFQLFPSNFFPT